MPECDHDWRVNPHIVLLSNPPREQLVCASCGARTTRTLSSSHNPSQAKTSRIGLVLDQNKPSSELVAALLNAEDPAGGRTGNEIMEAAFAAKTTPEPKMRQRDKPGWIMVALWALGIPVAVATGQYIGALAFALFVAVRAYSTWKDPRGL